MNDPFTVQVTSGGAPVTSTDDARQGVENHGVRYVLMWSLGSAIVVMAIAWFIFFAY